MGRNGDTGDFALSAALMIGLHTQRTSSRHALQHDLRVWYLRTCRECPDGVAGNRSYFRGRRADRHWFKRLCENQHFQSVISALSREQESLSRSISLVSWLKVAQQTVDDHSIPYKQSDRLSQLDQTHAAGGLRAVIFPELDKRLPDSLAKRPTAIASLSDFLGLPSAGIDVVRILRRHAPAPVPAKKSIGAAEITGLLLAWRVPGKK